MRALIALFLSLILALTAVTVAVARVQDGATTEMVVCAEGGAMLVTLDASGNPVERLHHCPDCTVALTGPVLPVQAPRHIARVAPIDRTMPGADLHPARTPDRPVARGPPILA